MSCGSDEEMDDMEEVEEDIALSGTLEFDGESFEISSGLISEVEIDSENNIASRTFYLSDATLTANGDNVTVSSDFGISLSIVFDAHGETDIVEGEYNTFSDANGRNANTSLLLTSGTASAFSGGTIDLSGSGNTFTLTFDAPFRGSDNASTNLTGTVTGTFEDL